MAPAPDELCVRLHDHQLERLMTRERFVDPISNAATQHDVRDFYVCDVCARGYRERFADIAVAWGDDKSERHHVCSAECFDTALNALVHRAKLR